MYSIRNCNLCDLSFHLNYGYLNLSAGCRLLVCSCLVVGGLGVLVFWWVLAFLGWLVGWWCCGKWNGWGWPTLLCVDLAFCLCMYVRSAWIGSVTAALIHTLGHNQNKRWRTQHKPSRFPFPLLLVCWFGWLVIGLLVWLAGWLLLVRWLVGWLVFVWLVHTLSFVCLSLFFLVLHRYRRSPRTLVGTVGSGCSKNCLSLPFPLWPYRCYRSGSFDFV